MWSWFLPPFAEEPMVHGASKSNFTPVQKHQERNITKFVRDSKDQFYGLKEQDKKGNKNENASEDEPFGSHVHREATVGDLDDDLGHGIFAAWLGVAATLAGVAVVGLFVQHQLETPKMKIVSDLCAVCAVLILLWDMFVFFGFRRRHWTAWILGCILIVFAVALCLLIFM